MSGRVEELLLRLVSGKLITLQHMARLLRGGNAATKVAEYAKNPRCKGAVAALTGGRSRQGANAEEDEDHSDGTDVARAEAGPGSTEPAMEDEENADAPRAQNNGRAETDDETGSEEEGGDAAAGHGRGGGRGPGELHLRTGCPLCEGSLEDDQAHFVWCANSGELWITVVDTAVRQALSQAGLAAALASVNRLSGAVNEISRVLLDNNAHYTRRCGLFATKRVGKTVMDAFQGSGALGGASQIRKFFRKLRLALLCGAQLVIETRQTHLEANVRRGNHDLFDFE